ncbi:MAG: hypothetical protein P1U59_06285 [Alcanivorax sp.]|uniref:TRADD-N-associated membrane domain-containing protein n=1 Tax=Alcanivorax sp. TaxID=1872427 RepID=UPI002608716C|nr:hypothetical protein [Alcanivorax sp.]MDF1724111.1 hypothetical protein [Alcanivorax sp.]
MESLIEVLSPSLLDSMFFGLSAVAMGVLANLLYSKFLNSQKYLEKQAETIAETYASSAKEAKSKLAEEALKQHPELTGISSAGGDINITIANENNDVKLSGDPLVQDLVNGYHQQALSQAKVQFWFSVFAAIVGFVYIINAGLKVNVDQLATVFNILPGAVIEAVAALFFRQAENTRERATSLYDRLREDDQANQARALIHSIEDEKVRSLVKAQVALHMVGLKPKELDLPTISKE